MLKPSRLRPGDRVAVIAPASPFNRDEFDKGVAELQRLGFDAVFEDTVFAQQGGYLSGAASVRAKAFLDAWRDPSVRALIAVRGGYGSVHLLPYLEKQNLRETPKAFIGYSDLTSVLTYLTASCGIVSFHGPMLDRRLGRGIDAYDRDSFVRALTSPEPLGELQAPGAGDVQKGRSGGTTARRNACAARRVARHAVCLQSTCWIRAVSRRRFRAALSDRSHADAVTPGRHSGVGVGVWSSESFRNVVSRAVSRQRERCSQTCSRTSRVRSSMVSHQAIRPARSSLCRSEFGPASLRMGIRD